MMEKIDVQGDNGDYTYQLLRDQSPLKGAMLEWNFEKFLLNGKGEVVKHFDTKTEPKSIVPDIEALLKWYLNGKALTFDIYNISAHFINNMIRDF